MSDEELLFVIVVLLAVGGFALAVAGLLESIGAPPDITGQIAAVLFFGIIVAGVYKLIT